jgi:periplasmic protein TonB
VTGQLSRGLTGSLGVSAALHVAVVALVIVARGDPPPPLPPIYRVNLVAAPPGERAPGIVTPTPSARPPDPAATPPPRSQSSPRDMAPPRVQPNRRTPVPATPSPAPTRRQADAAKAPPAGGGPVGDRGTDVAGVKIDGIEFPFQGYLDNIVRQIALRFKPSNTNRSLRAEVRFIIRRDGTVDLIRLSSPSRDYAFNLEATGAIEAAGTARAFGPLPAQYAEDALPVVFSFVPGLIR